MIGVPYSLTEYLMREGSWLRRFVTIIYLFRTSAGVLVSSNVSEDLEW